MPLKTALFDVHVGLGAMMTEFAGWDMPLRYGSDLAEHHAVRQRAGLFDLSHMGQLWIDGAGAADFLDYALVGKFSAMPEGRAKYTMIVNEEGRVEDDLIVYRLSPTFYMIVANGANREKVVGLLRQRITAFDATIEDATLQQALIAVQGPNAVAILEKMGVENLADLRYYRARPEKVAGKDVLLGRTGYTGEDGFELFCEATAAVELWGAISAAGEQFGLVPCGLACRDTLRLEAGMPLYGHELDATLTPYDAQLGRVVDLTKEKFVGKAALEHAAAGADDVPILVGLKAEGKRAPRAGYPVILPGGSGENAIGRITSGATSPTLGYPIAFAYVDKQHSEPGTALAVDVRGTPLPVTVTPIPFYTRNK